MLKLFDLINYNVLLYFIINNIDLRNSYIRYIIRFLKFN